MSQNTTGAISNEHFYTTSFVAESIRKKIDCTVYAQEDKIKVGSIDLSLFGKYKPTHYFRIRFKK